MTQDRRSTGSQLLEPLASPEGWAILKQGSDRPVLRGSTDRGNDLICASCGEMTLAENIAEGEIWDIGFQCYRCGGFSAGPQLPPGAGLSRPLVTFPPGIYLITDTVQNREWVVSAGTTAVERRARETGSPMFGVAQAGPRVILDGTGLASIIHRINALLPQVLERIGPRDARLVAAGAPPQRRHRLMVLLQRAAEAVAGFTTDAAKIDIGAVMELRLMADLLERWQNDPAWQTIVHSLMNPSDYPHAIVTLAAVSLLSDLGNGVALHTQTGTRASDLRIRVGPLEQVAVEVKAPLALQWIEADLTHDAAMAVVLAALKSAGTGQGMQLGPDYPGLLVIGGFYLRETDLDQLEIAAQRLLSKHRARRQHLAGVALVSIGLDITLQETAMSERDGLMMTGGEPTATQTLAVRIAMNPSYNGPVRLASRYATNQ